MSNVEIDDFIAALESIESDINFYRLVIPHYFKNKEIPLDERWNFFCNIPKFYWDDVGKLSDHPDLVKHLHTDGYCESLDMKIVDIVDLVFETKDLLHVVENCFNFPDVNSELLLIKLKEKILEIGIRYFIVNVKY